MNGDVGWWVPRLLGVLIGAGALVMAGCQGGSEPCDYRVVPVGYVQRAGGTTSIEIEEEYADALAGLEDFSHVLVFYWLHHNDTCTARGTLLIHPHGEATEPPAGVFATRCSRRPNLIALSLCEIQSIEDHAVIIDWIDALDDSPVLDLKPYLPAIDSAPDAAVPDWVW